MSSMAAFQPGPFMAVYYASKAYVLSLSEALTTRFVPRSAAAQFVRRLHKRALTTQPGPPTGGG